MAHTRPGMLVSSGRGRVTSTGLTAVALCGKATMKGVSYYVKCLMCSTEIGRIANGGLVPRSPRAEPASYRGGLPRCSHCGRSRYLAPPDPLEPPRVYPTIDALAAL